MYAIKVENMFGKDWKDCDKNYLGREHMVMYNGVEYYPLDKAIESDYIVRLKHIEEINYED